MGTTIAHWGYIGIMENKLGTTIAHSVVSKAMINVDPIVNDIDFQSLPLLVCRFKRASSDSLQGCCTLSQDRIFAAKGFVIESLLVDTPKGGATTPL